MDALERDVLLRILALCSCRDVLALACTCRELSGALQEDALWRELAEHKWGPAVRQLASVQPGGWAAWVKHRLSASSHPLSPLDLVQEHYQDCPFQHLVACVLCSRTTGGPTVREAISLFLSLYPTPSDVLAAQESSLLEVMRPLGLPATRLAAVQGIARDFLATHWQDPSEFKHCGKFVSDSWRIFCRGQRSSQGVEDKNLQRYLRWLQSGSTEERGGPGGKQQLKGAAGAGKRKREADKGAEPGTLRSGRRREGCRGGGGRGAADSAAGGGRVAGRSRGTPAAGERRLTRAAAANAAPVSPAGVAAGRAKEAKQRRG